MFVIRRKRIVFPFSFVLFLCNIFFFCIFFVLFNIRFSPLALLITGGSTHTLVKRKKLRIVFAFLLIHTFFLLTFFFGIIYSYTFSLNLTFCFIYFFLFISPCKMRFIIKHERKKFNAIFSSFFLQYFFSHISFRFSFSLDSLLKGLPML